MKPHEYNTEERLVAANEEVRECADALRALFFDEIHDVEEYKKRGALMGGVFEVVKEIIRHSERAGMLKAALAVQEAYKQQL